MVKRKKSRVTTRGVAVVYAKRRQTGKKQTARGKKADAKIRASPPGKRVSKAGKRDYYYEYRRNRTDV